MRSIKQLFFICLALTLSLKLNAYSLTGVNTAFNFGTIAPPFANLTLTDNGVCVGYAALAESANYYVKATSASSTSSAFLLTNSANSAYSLNYTVSWAGTASSTPSYVALSSGQNSSSTFPAQLLGTLTCAVLPANATLQLQLLGADQMLAKQGTYTDTLTILIVSS